MGEATVPPHQPLMTSDQVMTSGLCRREDRAALDGHLAGSPGSDTGAPDGRHALVRVINLSAKVWKRADTGRYGL